MHTHTHRHIEWRRDTQTTTTTTTTTITRVDAVLEIAECVFHVRKKQPKKERWKERTRIHLKSRCKERYTSEVLNTHLCICTSIVTVHLIYDSASVDGEGVSSELCPLCVSYDSTDWSLVSSCIYTWPCEMKGKGEGGKGSLLAKSLTHYTHTSRPLILWLCWSSYVSN